ncbi:KTR2 [Symbiodinium natans]|uniref:KTR2 protein n=1 Tax=Symbiodinium natans TaxID=878477 RepID=A0A812S8H0_9DINO|nr:KTR2 [Symbiodinium natans]
MSRIAWLRGSAQSSRAVRKELVGCRSLASSEQMARSRPGAKDAPMPRWPFLRSKALSAGLSDFLSQGPEQLLVSGARGSGASTAIRAALAQLGSSPASPMTVVLDCSQAGKGSLEDAFRKQLAEQLATLEEQEALIESMMEAVVAAHPEVEAALVASVTAVSGRQGLPGAVPSGTEVPACRALLDKRLPAPKLVAAASSVLAALPRNAPNRPSAALAFLCDAGARQGPHLAMSCLLTAGRRAAVTSQGDLVLVLLRADAAEGALRNCLDPPSPGDAGAGKLRVLLQSYDALRAIRTSAAGVPVLTADEWSEEMARAIVQPRFLPSEEVTEWSAMWAAVGGHASHLKQVAEALVEERRSLEAKRRQQEMDELRQEIKREREQPVRRRFEFYGRSCPSTGLLMPAGLLGSPALLQQVRAREPPPQKKLLGPPASPSSGCCSASSHTN